MCSTSLTNMFMNDLFTINRFFQSSSYLIHIWLQYKMQDGIVLFGGQNFVLGRQEITFNICIFNDSWNTINQLICRKSKTEYLCRSYFWLHKFPENWDKFFLSIKGTDEDKQLSRYKKMWQKSSL